MVCGAIHVWAEGGLSGWKFWLSGYRFSFGSSLTFDSQLAIRSSRN